MLQTEWVLKTQLASLKCAEYRVTKDPGGPQPPFLPQYDLILQTLWGGAGDITYERLFLPQYYTRIPEEILLPSVKRK
ncbi:hypothetical protein SKAU_G00102390 [Synaphobranchus kaupii]|uniref:Uncharacterized protein n=1 Tax=Synaphobranchus kaupii TaxID=118154 RepID=A0A9Q1FYU6_SYNKA|nr:hypothetical protein SKAU_G00102390 [Synaphobranchus kaupii]